jgi:hypothetical protein
MTFLELCQRLVQESGGLSGTGPTTTASQTGDMGKVVDWILSAYEDIQNLHPDWNFLRNELTFQTIAAQQAYTPAQAGYTEYGEWIKDSFRSYLTSSGVNGEIEMEWREWEDFRATYMLGAIRATTTQPYIVSQKPDTSLILWPIPDAAYTINGEYFKRAQTMTDDGDIPIIPVKYQMIIVWRALMFYAGWANAPEMYQVGQKEFRRLLNQLELSQLPAIRLAEPLV